MQKQAIAPLLGMAAGGIARFTAGKVLPKILTTGYKGLVEPMARTALRHPGLAITGAMMPSWISGNMNAASQKGLSSLPRSLPKFASRDALHASKQGEEMSNKYPSIFYKIEGFEKMAAEAEATHRLVRDWDRGLAKKAGTGMDIIKGITGWGQKSTISILKEDMAKSLAEDVRKAFSVKEIPKIVANYKDRIALVAKEIKPKNLWEALRGGSKLMGALTIGIPAYYFVNKAYKKYKENKEMDVSYKNILRTFPELQRENPHATRQNFDYIRQYSPTVAQNPYAAGTIIKGVVAGRGIDQSTIKGLLDIEKVKSDSQPRHKGLLGTIGDMI